MPTKTYSTRQEKMIARYLGWEVVSASGARSFCPGDVRSADWLGECKTHMRPQDRVVVELSVWNKIQEEARSVFKAPVLFVDDGTQKADHTWCVFDYIKWASGKVSVFNPNLQIRKNLVFKPSILSPTYHHMQRASDVPVVASFQLDEKPLGIISLWGFNQLFGEGSPL